jgi:hypothetical protein
MSFDSFFSDVLSTVVGGTVLTFLFFLGREKLFPLPPMVGRWYFEIQTTSTDYAPYQGMVLRYVAMIWPAEYRIEGTAEKIYEDSSTGIRPFVGEHRTRAVVEGVIQKQYFSSDKVFLHVVEEGHGRESTNFFRLVVHADGTMMIGTFSSTVANQEGRSVWQRKPF